MQELYDLSGWILLVRNAVFSILGWFEHFRWKFVCTLSGLTGHLLATFTPSRQAPGAALVVSDLNRGQTELSWDMTVMKRTPADTPEGC